MPSKAWTSNPIITTQSAAGAAGTYSLKGAGGASESLAQSFQIQIPTSAAPLISVSVKLRSFGSPTDTVNIDIVSALDGSSLANGNMSAATLTSTNTWYEFSMTPTLSADTTYYIQLTRTSANDGTNYIASSWVTSSQYSLGDFWHKDSGVWTEVSSQEIAFEVKQSTTNLRDVAYGNDYWVAVGDSGAMYYKSGDPSGAWTSNTQGSVAFKGVAYGNGYWVAVGDAGALYYKQGAPTGAWTSNSQGSDDIRAVAYAGGNWACAGVRYIKYNALVPTGTWTNGLDVGAGVPMNDICHDGFSTWFAIGGTYPTVLAYSSTNLSSWTDRHGALNSLTLSACAAGSTYGDGPWYVFGGWDFGGAFLWQNLTISLSGGSTVNAGVTRAMCYGGGWFVRVGDSGMMKASTHPANIAKGTSPDDWSSVTQGSAHLYGVGYGNVSEVHYWVAVGASGALIYAANYPMGPSDSKYTFTLPNIAGTPATVETPREADLGIATVPGWTQYLVVEYYPGNAVSVSDSTSPWTAMGVEEISAQTAVGVWYRRCTGAETQNGTTVSQTSANHLHCVIGVVCDVHSEGNPFSISTFSQDAGSNTSVSVAGVTTSEDDELVYVVVATAFDAASDYLANMIGSWTNASLANFTELYDFGAALGNGGTLGIASGTRVSAGSSGTSTATLANAAQKCHNVHAHKPKKHPRVITEASETYRLTPSPARW